MALEMSSISASLGIPTVVLVLILVWIIVWKGFALWKAARLNQPVWFIIILIVNTFGILEILYLFLFSKINLEEKVKSRNSQIKRKIRKKKRK